MKKNTKIILSLFLVISFTTVLFVLENADKEQNSLNTNKTYLTETSEQIRANKNTQSKNEISQPSEKINTANLALRKKLSADPVAIRDTLEALGYIYGDFSKPIDKEKQAKQLSILADLYPDELLLQFLASSSCAGYHEFEFCNLDVYINRIRELAPTNAIADKFQFKYHLDNNDLTSALSTLENIDEKSYYDNYFPDLLNEFTESINQNPNLIGPLPEHIRSNSEVAVGLFLANPTRPIVFAHCAKQAKTNSQKERWANACNRFAKIMTSATDLMGKSLGLSLQMHSIEQQNINIGLEELNNKKTKLNRLIRTYGNLSNSDFFYDPDNFSLWLDDLVKYGEIIAAERFIVRYREAH